MVATSPSLKTDCVHSVSVTCAAHHARLCNPVSNLGVHSFCRLRCTLQPCSRHSSPELVKDMAWRQSLARMYIVDTPFTSWHSCARQLRLTLTAKTYQVANSSIRQRAITEPDTGRLTWVYRCLFRVHYNRQTTPLYFHRLSSSSPEVFA